MRALKIIKYVIDSLSFDEKVTGDISMKELVATPPHPPSPLCSIITDTMQKDHRDGSGAISLKTENLTKLSR
jgi:hypothetical protein